MVALLSLSVYAVQSYGLPASSASALNLLTSGGRVDHEALYRQRQHWGYDQQEAAEAMLLLDKALAGGEEEQMQVREDGQDSSNDAERRRRGWWGGLRGPRSPCTA
jgi:hypothetical protein